MSTVVPCQIPRATYQPNNTSEYAHMRYSFLQPFIGSLSDIVYLSGYMYILKNQTINKFGILTYPPLISAIKAKHRRSSHCRLLIVHRLPKKNNIGYRFFSEPTLWNALKPANTVIIFRQNNLSNMDHYSPCCPTVFIRSIMLVLNMYLTETQTRTHHARTHI